MLLESGEGGGGGVGEGGGHWEEQALHALRQDSSMYEGFLSHSPYVAHAAQEADWSTHVLA